VNDAEAQSWAEKALDFQPCWACFVICIVIVLGALGIAIWSVV